MVQSIRKIGNSNGVLIPKSMLISCGITEDVEMEVIGDAIVMRSSKKHPRDGWEEAFKLATQDQPETDGDLFEGMKNEFDKEDWNW
jgi:antitoxin MazE